MPGRPSDLHQPIPGYEVLDLLGSGGMSSVYRARQRGLDRLVAIKVIRRDQLDPRTALARLTKEAQMLARLDHPGIVRSIDFGEAGDLVYFVMELIEGRSCKDLLTERGPLPLREVLTIGERVAEALDHAARHGVVHRDVKPGNILLARDGSVKLTDFGLARATSDRSLTKAGITVGTPQYMSPEQVKSPKRVDLRSDFYSLGATLYHLATGRAPFAGETVGEILHEVLYGRPVPAEQVDPTLPPAFSRLLARLLARDPARRYSSGAELLQDFARVRAAIEAGGAGGEVGLSWQDAGESPPFRWLPWSMVAAGVIVAVAAGSLLFHSSRGNAPRDTSAGEQRLIDDLRANLASGARPAVAIALDVERLRDDGTLTNASAAARVELVAAALDRFTHEIGSAVRDATAAAMGALAHGDFAASRNAFDQSLATACDRLVPRALRAALPQTLHDFDEALRRAAASGLAPLDTVVDAVSRRIGAALSEVQDRNNVRFLDALARLDFATAQQVISQEAADERRASAAATRSELVAAGVAVAADATDDELIRGWPEVLAESARRAAETTKQDVGDWKRSLASAIAHCGQDALAAVAEARSTDLADVADPAKGTPSPEPGVPDPSPINEHDAIAKRSAVLMARVAPARAALLAAGASVDELDKALDEHRSALESAVAQRRQRRATEELTLLLDGDGDSEHPGLQRLLIDRKLADARARIEKATALADEDRARWSAVVVTLEACLSSAEAALHAKVGGAVNLRDRRGLGFSGKLSEESGGSFRVDKVNGLRVVDLHLDSLLGLLPANALDERANLLATFYFGDPKARGGLDARLAAGGDDPLFAHLRAFRNEEASGVAATQKRREGDATAALQRLRDSLAKGDATTAQASWSELSRLRGTEAARTAFADREKFERAIDASRAKQRRELRLAAIAPHASERVDDPEAGVQIGYDFNHPEQGGDWGLVGNDIRIENGRMHFAGGDTGRRARIFGPLLALPLDRKFPATLELDLTPSVDESSEPHFVGVRVGATCVGFFRPTPEVRAMRDEYGPQLAVWFGTLDDYAKHFFEPSLMQTEPPGGGKCFQFGLERGVRKQVKIRWLPASDGASGTVEVWLDKDKVASGQGTMSAPATPPEKDAIELRSATTLDIESLKFTGRIRG